MNHGKSMPSPQIPLFNKLLLCSFVIVVILILEEVCEIVLSHLVQLLWVVVLCKYIMYVVMVLVHYSRDTEDKGLLWIPFDINKFVWKKKVCMYKYIYLKWLDLMYINMDACVLDWQCFLTFWPTWMASQVITVFTLVWSS